MSRADMREHLDLATIHFEATSNGMRALGKALADLAVALSPILREIPPPPDPTWRPDPIADRCSYIGCMRVRERERDRCFWHRREVHPAGPPGSVPCRWCGGAGVTVCDPCGGDGDTKNAGGSSEPTGGDR